MSELLIYGAYGYTGELIARLAVERGLRPVLAGRDATRVAALAGELNLPHRVFPLDDPAALDAGLAGAAVVLHCAGPYHRTYRAMADGCLRAGAHYLDITGEIAVFEGLAARDDEARDAGVMLLPGVGFDVVPSDCLAAHLAARLPSATRLTMAFASRGARLSRGTATTAVESLHLGSAVREGGELRSIPAGSRTRDIDYGRGPVPSMAIPWGDVSTAWHSTGIPNIEVYIPAKRGVRLASRLAGLLSPLTRSAMWQSWARGRIQAGPPGPSAEERARSTTTLWGEVTDDTGARAETRMTTPNGYSLTADTALDIACRALDGAARPGFQTPSKLFGADFVLGFDGVSRDDVA